MKKKKKLTQDNVAKSVKDGFNRSFADKVRAFMGKDKEEEEEEDTGLGSRISKGLKKLRK